MVFSDCRPWSGPSATYFTCDCGYVGKTCDEDYELALAGGYASYSPFHQAGGEEQATTREGSSFESRSTQVLTCLLKQNLIRSNGSLLDYGSGNGSFLKASAELIPEMKLNAADITDLHKNSVLSLPHVESFQVLPLEPSGDQNFDVISLIHVLEHVPDPITVLTELATRLTRGGVIVIQVPDFSANYFDLVVADHLSHFTEESVTNLARVAGFEIALCASGVVSKEITLVLHEKKSALREVLPSKATAQRITGDAFAFLEKWEQLASATRARKLPISIFGSSISASWLLSLMHNEISLVKEFIDEDPARQGRQLRSVSITQPSHLELSERAEVLVPLVPSVAEAVSFRLQTLGFKPVFFT